MRCILSYTLSHNDEGNKLVNLALAILGLLIIGNIAGFIAWRRNRRQPHDQ